MFALSLLILYFLNPFMHYVEKWSKILEKSCGVNTARSLKNIRPFFNIMHESVKGILMQI